jgi:acyl carrier protein
MPKSKPDSEKGVHAVDERFVALLRTYLPLLDEGPVAEDARLRDLGMDSIRTIDLLIGIETTFQISLPEGELNDETFATAGRLWRAIAAARGVG